MNIGNCRRTNPVHCSTISERPIESSGTSDLSCSNRLLICLLKFKGASMKIPLIFRNHRYHASAPGQFALSLTDTYGCLSILNFHRCHLDRFLEGADLISTTLTARAAYPYNTSHTT